MRLAAPTQSRLVPTGRSRKCCSAMRPALCPGGSSAPVLWRHAHSDSGSVDGSGVPVRWLCRWPRARCPVRSEKGSPPSMPAGATAPKHRRLHTASKAPGRRPARCGAGPAAAPTAAHAACAPGAAVQVRRWRLQPAALRHHSRACPARPQSAAAVAAPGRPATQPRWPESAVRRQSRCPAHATAAAPPTPLASCSPAEKRCAPWPGCAHGLQGCGLWAWWTRAQQKKKKPWGALCRGGDSKTKRAPARRPKTG